MFCCQFCLQKVRQSLRQSIAIDITTELFVIVLFAKMSNDFRCKFQFKIVANGKHIRQNRLLDVDLTEQCINCVCLSKRNKTGTRQQKHATT